MKLKLILVTVLAFGSIAHAQGFMSHLSLGAGFEGIFPAATVTKATSNLEGLPTTQWSTKAVGYVGDLRYDFGRHSAIGVAVTFNRNSELFEDTTQAVSHVQTNNLEMIGTYIFRLPSNERVKPFAMFGGGMVRFSPNNNFSVDNNSPATDTKPAFAYGFGSDFAVSPRWAIRLQYRGLVRAAPDFKLSSAPFGTGLKTHVAEPSIQLVYHF